MTRTGTTLSEESPAGDSPLDVMAEGLERMSAALPDGHGLLAAVCDPPGRPSDLLVREAGGETSFLLGLPAEHNAGVARLFSATLELARTVVRLEQANRELAEFARVTAHDLAAPLRALSGLVDLLAPASREQEASETFGAIRSALTRMQAMVDGAVGYAHAQDAPVRRDPVDLDRILGYARAALGADIARTGAVVVARPLPTVLGDEHQLERLLVSLLANAIRYSAPGVPRIALEALREGEAWRIAVSDEGIGVEAGAEERIFLLFERGSRAAALGGGTGRGIGLATCRRIVEMHGGRIWVEANEPRGSVFTFTLPAAS